MARGGEGNGGGNVMDMLVWMSIGILVLAIIYRKKVRPCLSEIMLIPVIGGNFEQNMPALASNSMWNASYNTKLTTGASFWTGLILLVLSLRKLAESIKSPISVRIFGRSRQRRVYYHLLKKVCPSQVNILFAAANFGNQKYGPCLPNGAGIAI